MTQDKQSEKKKNDEQNSFLKGEKWDSIAKH